MLCPPDHAAIIDLFVVSQILHTLIAVSVGSVIACGTKIANTASTFGSSNTILIAFAYLSGVASPITSTGLPCDQMEEVNHLVFALFPRIFWQGYL